MLIAFVTMHMSVNCGWRIVCVVSGDGRSIQGIKALPQFGSTYPFVTSDPRSSHVCWQLTKEEMEAKGWKEDKTDIFEEFQKMQENMDIDNWDNVRGPRPWEDDNQKYIDIINQRIKENEEAKKKAGVFWK